MTKKLFFLQVLMLLVAVLVPQVAWADYYYCDADENGTISTKSVASVNEITSSTTTWGKTGETTYYYSINDSIESRVTVLGTVYLILKGDAELKCKDGITVEGDNKLIITSGGDSVNFSQSGSLVARLEQETENEDAAVIGGRDKNTCGTIIFNGGKTTVYSVRYNGAGIGSGYKGSGGNVIINGGTIYSTIAYITHQLRANNGAAIGSGREATTGCNITINGGDVHAYQDGDLYEGRDQRYQDAHGACIGGGYKAACGTITINGGNVEAVGLHVDEPYAAAIGGGYESSSDININITGGTIYACMNKSLDGFSAGIGSGRNSSGKLNINISGGNVTAYSTSYKNKKVISTEVSAGKGYGAGIGLGKGSEFTGSINISGGNIKAISSYNYIGYGAGIGAGDNCGSSHININISGGKVYARSGETYTGFWAQDGAGIGCGEDGGCDSITITGGDVAAHSGAWDGADMNGAGIGDGETKGKCKSIIIMGDSTIVEAYGLYAFSAQSVKAAAVDQEKYAVLAKFGKEGNKNLESSTGASMDLTSKAKANRYSRVTFEPLTGKVVYYKDSEGEVQSCQALPVIGDGTLKGTYYVDGSFDVNRIIVSDTLHLILLDGCQLNAKGCIVVENSNTLTITSGNTTEDIAGTGTLTVCDSTGGNNGNDARIGSREGNSCGYININGGNITAYSTYDGTYSIHGADIGSGHEGSNGCIVINDGKVYCQGGQYLGKNSMSGAGIGSGYEATSGTVWIRIHGGKVRTWPTNNYTCWGAGIGTGQGAKGRADIVIDGGEVEALSSTNDTGKGAGIGTGCDYKASDNTTIEINGGTVYACSSGCGDSKQGYGAGIGMGSGWSSSYGKVDISITGGTVHAYSGNYYAYGAGIGGGDDGGCGNIVISGTADVGAYNCRTYNTPEGPGIGDGDEDAGGTLNVYGPQCIVDTWGKYGIGNTSEGKFKATVYPMGGTSKIESGDKTYGTNNDNSPQYYTASQNINYGSSQWRKITFETTTKDVYYTNENGEVTGPVSAFVCTTGVPGILGGDSTTTMYYYIDTIVTAATRPDAKCNAVLILGDNAQVKTPSGINVEDDNTLTITAGGTTADYAATGTLTASLSSGENAAIGSRGYYSSPFPNSCGNIIINAGNVNATAYYYGAAIGSGKNAAEGGSITINGGNVTAYASPGDTYHGYGAGIGGGSNRTNPDIIINGGTIKACSATSSKGWGAGIGAGNGAAAGDIRINGGTITAYSSESGENFGPGMGGGYDESSQAILVGGIIKVYGDEADVNTFGHQSIVATTIIATGANYNAVVDYHSHLTDMVTETGQAIDLNNMGSDSASVSDYKYAHIYFQPRQLYVFYTQEDGTVSSDSVAAYDCPGYLPDTLGDGTSTPVYYFLNGNPEQTNRSTVSGNAVIVIADDCDASVAGGITVEEGNTLTITTGDTTQIYDGTGAIDVLSDDHDNAAIGSTKPDGNARSYAGHTAGTINIYDGTIVAHVVEEGSSDEAYAAAIGGGAGNGNAGIINITGGNVTAYCAYSGNGKGAGIGGGNGEWFGRRDGGCGGTVTISGNAHVEAYSSVTSSAVAAGIGRGCDADLLSDYTGTVTIKGDSAVVIAKGVCAIYAATATATPVAMNTVVEYGTSAASYDTYNYGGEVNLLAFGSTSLSNVVYAKVYFTEPETLTLAEALDSTENVNYTISDDLYIKKYTDEDSILWCTDGHDNWVKVVSNDYEAIKDADMLQGGSIMGKMSNLDTNPVLTLSTKPTTADSDKIIDLASYNVVNNFSEAKPDEIAYITGYYFVENGTPKFRGYGGSNPNHKGQSLVLDLTKYLTGVTVEMTEGNFYWIPCAIQINAPWDEEETSSAPRRVSKSDGDTYFTNYTAYALEGPRKVTGITENTLNKEISHIDYVNTIGQVSTEPWQGINIVVTHFTDGSTSTVKVVK